VQSVGAADFLNRQIGTAVGNDSDIADAAVGFGEADKAKATPFKLFIKLV
jgi:hypothetical protein